MLVVARRHRRTTPAPPPCHAAQHGELGAEHAAPQSTGKEPHHELPYDTSPAGHRRGDRRGRRSPGRQRLARLGERGQRLCEQESNGTQFDQADIDGRFGANTKYATKQLQKAWGLTQDGVVGKNTFGAADDKWNASTKLGELEFRGAGSTSATKSKLRYHGSRFVFDVYRTSDGKYRIYHNSHWQYASYKNNSTCG
ncbi:peptidoglycan-binding domain-containing protein [Streptomyces justiciae]|uniref:Peptidoglycan-binding domain-containing protein n=1 Tax=Streptomyces justiciae TaxID=2780140 RepID=A0ABU3LNT5_9ACTN|nr:peptidoglycan-binding domain-containing protein [Streptomyces justiciae]MDT7840728.1 peptidoglycan-binding domain-containing protein [Streptomyces justiciae]